MVGLLFLLSALACDFSALGGQSPPNTPSDDSGQPTLAESSASSEDTNQPDLDQRPLIWFAPLPPMEIREGRPFIGSDDFMDLFVPDSPWTTAASRVQVFKLYGEWVAEDATDAELQQVVADLDRRGIALAVEAGPLPPRGCGEGVEGFGELSAGVSIAQRIKNAGGTLQYLAFDEPFAFANIYDGPNVCHWPADRIARGIEDYVGAVRTIFPDVVVGDIEPLWVGADLDLFKTWMETYETVTGAPLTFFILDVDFTRPNWPQDAKELEDFARAHGVDFGMIYFGDWEDTSDEVWLGKAEERMVLYESLAGGRPDYVFFQSWHDHPDHVLPETSPNTFTNFIDRYARTRTTLDVTAERTGGDAPLVVSGTLLDEDGNPVAGRNVAYVTTPLNGSGVYGEFTVSGVVPDGATRADVGFRVNTECDCSGTSDFTLYDVSYVEDDGANHIPNPNFSAGLGSWGIWGEANARLEASDRDGGSALHVTATPAQTAGMNSEEFTVSAGASYTVTFGARVSPESVGSGYFSMIFLGPATEVSRQQIQLEPATFATGSTETGANGEFTFTLAEPPPDMLEVEVSFAGDDEYWPALTRATAPGT